MLLHCMSKTLVVLAGAARDGSCSIANYENASLRLLQSKSYCARREYVLGVLAALQSNC